MPEAVVSGPYAEFVGRVYGVEVRERFEQILVERGTGAVTRYSALDQARSEVYRKQNEAVAASGHRCFDSDEDL